MCPGAGDGRYWSIDDAWVLISSMFIMQHPAAVLVFVGDGYEITRRLSFRILATSLCIF